LPFAGLILLGIALSGCGGGESAGPSPAVNPSADSIKHRPASELPAVGAYLPPLDDGRIEIAPPADWNTMSRDARYLVRFVKGKASELPRITITVWDTPLPEITELTEANAGQLAAELVTQMKKDKKTVPEPPKPIVLGDTLFLRHVRRAKLASGDHVVVQALDTVRGGRIYTVELIAMIDAPRPEQYEESLRLYRNDGYAVAANLKFPGSESATPPSKETPADQPAEDNPAP
jgi:hypothetical protein